MAAWDDDAGAEVLAEPLPVLLLEVLPELHAAAASATTMPRAAPATALAPRPGRPQFPADRGLYCCRECITCSPIFVY